ncbi:MAG: aminotransferase class V-fold PLP-dependent enzyme [Planctomycetota bacterium]
MKTIYFDNAATSWPKPDIVYEAMNYFMQEVGANPGRSGHSKSVEAARIVHQTRENIAQLFNVQDTSPLGLPRLRGRSLSAEGGSASGMTSGTDNVIFTSNATHSLNIIFKGILHSGDNVVTTSMEHNSVMRPLRYLEQNTGISITVVPCLADGTLPLELLEEQIEKDTKLIVVNHASNVVGTILPIGEIGKISRKHGVLFLVDAAQTAGIIPLDMVNDNIDLLVFTGHKGLMGPQGIGGLCIRNDVDMTPLMQGGTGSNSEYEIQPEVLPDKYESGTLNTVGIAGLGAGVKFIQETGIVNIHKYEKALTKQLIEGLSTIAGIKLYGLSNAEKQIPVVSFNIEGYKPSDIGYKLDKEFGIMARAGLHCAPMAHKTIGTFPEGTVRLSLNYFNKSEEIDYTVQCLRKIAASCYEKNRGSETLCIVTFYSTHHVLEAEKAIKNKGLEVKLIPTPREFSSNCGIAMSLLWENKEVAVEILTNKGIPIEKIHKKNETTNKH